MVTWVIFFASFERLNGSTGAASEFLLTVNGHAMIDLLNEYPSGRQKGRNRGTLAGHWSTGDRPRFSVKAHPDTFSGKKAFCRKKVSRGKGVSDNLENRQSVSSYRWAIGSLKEWK